MLEDLYSPNSEPHSESELLSTMDQEAAECNAKEVQKGSISTGT